MPARMDSTSATRGGMPSTASHTCARMRAGREPGRWRGAARWQNDYLQGRSRKSVIRTGERIRPTKSFSFPTAVPTRTYCLLCLPVSSSPSNTMLYRDCVTREGSTHTCHCVLCRPAVFVRDSKVNLRQHAHRESGPFLRDKKEWVNPQVPEPPGNVLQQKNECKTFLNFFYGFIQRS